MDFVVEYKDCCGCGACHEVCPKNAISMKTDECGYVYASIDGDLCIDCGKCRSICPAIKNDHNKDFIKKTYAGTSLDGSAKESTSGGVFALFAKKVLADGGVVFGTEMDESFNVQVIGISDEKDLPKLQGSKYVQSNMLPAFKQIKDAVKDKKVLFCGTPCQVSALKNYIGKENDNLILVDLVCHGVPNNQMFKGEIAAFQRKYKNNLCSFKFRNKNYGQASVGSIGFKNGEVKRLNSTDSIYYSLFYTNDILRESCYNCVYSNTNRPGDITICDYWGVQNEEPAFYNECNEKGMVGISGIIVNTQKGEAFFEENKEGLLYIESTVEKIKNGNPHFTNPSKKGADSEDIRNAYKQNGWEGVSKFYRKKYRWKNFARKIYNICPNFLKNLAKKVLGK